MSRPSGTLHLNQSLVLEIEEKVGEEALFKLKQKDCEISGSVFQFSSLPQSLPTLCDPMDCSTPGFAVHHQLLELAQTHVHWVSEAIQPPHPLSCPSPPVFNLSIFSNESALPTRWPKFHLKIGVSASASVLPMNIQDWLPLGWTGWISFQSKGLSRVFSYTTVQKHQLFRLQLSLWSNSHIHTWLLEKL